MLLKIATLPLLTVINAQLLERSVNNDLVFNYQQCAEPANRFFVNHANQFRNVDLRGENKPQKFVCQFCDAQLFQVVNDICCNVKSRKRRESDTQQFWLGDDLDKRNKTKNSQNFEKTQNSDWVKRECKEGEIDSKSNLDDVLGHLKFKSGEENESNIPKSRKKRENEEKRRTHVSEMDDTCTKNIRSLEYDRNLASDFLGGGSFRDALINGGSGNNGKNRRKYKHTFLQQECCDTMGGDSTCDYQEIGESNLQEECCQEGCVIEEITENCGSWRWDLKEGW